MEDILALLLIFGGGIVIALAFSPIGRAVADRVRFGKTPLPAPEPDPAIYEELDRLRNELGDLEERLNFAERLLVRPDGSETLQ